jgi:hypothetical protein
VSLSRCCGLFWVLSNGIDCLLDFPRQKTGDGRVLHYSMFLLVEFQIPFNFHVCMCLSAYVSNFVLQLLLRREQRDKFVYLIGSIVIIFKQLPTTEEERISLGRTKK